MGGGVASNSKRKKEKEKMRPIRARTERGQAGGIDGGSGAVRNGNTVMLAVGLH